MQRLQSLREHQPRDFQILPNLKASQTLQEKIQTTKKEETVHSKLILDINQVVYYYRAVIITIYILW